MTSISKADFKSVGRTDATPSYFNLSNINFIAKALKFKVGGETLAVSGSLKC